ncbi:MAG: glycosyltransferase [Candidatus Saccharimonadales bacterium]
MSSNFSIIIPTLNEERALPRLLESIAAQSFAGELEVIVVDGESTDSTRDVTLAYKKSISNLSVITTHRGLSHQRNFGASKAQHDYLVFIDADSVLSREFLARLSKQLDRTTDVIALPLILPYKGSPLDYIFTLGAYVFFMLARFTGPVVTGMCLITSKAIHQRIGGFDEKAVYAEDIEYGLRSFRQGATYHIYCRARLFGSTRRGRKLGRLKLGSTWLKWYFDTWRHGPITDRSKYNYKYDNDSRSST